MKAYMKELKASIKGGQSLPFIDSFLKKVSQYSSSSIYDKVLEERIRKRIGKIRYMKQETPFNEIEFDTPLAEIPEKFITGVLGYIGYINETQKKEFIIQGINTITGEHTEKRVPYVHRWTDIYKKSILAKLYQLEEEYPDCYRDLCMISLTLEQEGRDPEENLLILQKNKPILFKALRDRFGTIDYFSILEPHKTSYPHLHVLYMKRLSDVEQTEIKYLWSSYSDPSSKDHFEHGLTFSDVRASENGNFEAGSVSRIRGYLMKYLVKGLFNKEKYSYTVGGRSVTTNMPLNELLFNSLLKKHKIKLWTCSRHFSQIMKRKETEKTEGWECIEIDQVYGEQKTIHWVKGYGLRPSFIWIWRPFCSWTEKPLTELYERHGYKIEYNKNQNLWTAFQRVCIPAECA